MRIIVTCCVILLGVLVLPIPGNAASAPGVVGEGTPASCTESALRTAIANVAANATVTFNCGPDPVTIPTRRLDFFADRKIDGGGTVTLSGCVPTTSFGLSCTSNERIIAIAAGATVNLRGLTLANGFDRGESHGGCVNVAVNAGLILTDVTLRDCQVDSRRFGGAIWSSGILGLNNTTIVSSRAHEGGGIYIAGGGFTMVGGAFRGNTAEEGGGGALFTRNASVTLVDVVFEDNRAEYGGGWAGGNGSLVSGSQLLFARNDADFGGGALYSLFDSNPTPMILEDATFIGNTSAYGGALYLSSAGQAALTNVTIHQNNATNVGGGIYIQGGRQTFRDRTYSSKLMLTNATIAGNSAQSGGGIAADSQTNLQDVTIKNVVFDASPEGGNCKITGFTSSYSLSSDGTCGLSGSGDRNNLDPLLGVLAGNSGTTQTLIPGRGSPLIDGVAGSDCPPTDQRRVARPQGASCDIGAVEVRPVDYLKSIMMPLILR